MSSPVILGVIKGAQALSLLRTALFNLYGLNVYGISISGQDTIFTYQIQTDQKLTAAEKRQIPLIAAFCKGFSCAL